MASDPSGEREAFRAAPTVNDLLDRYITEHVEQKNRPSTAAAFKGIVERDIRPALGLLKVAAVTRQDMHRFHAPGPTTPRQANLILAVCSKAFSLAEVWEMRADGTNPCAKIERYPENHRERFLSAEELGRLGGTLRQAESVGLPGSRLAPGRRSREAAPPSTGASPPAAIELLLFTGCRLSEVLNLRWEQVNFDAGTIALPETKSGRPQTVVMNAPARQVLKELEHGQGIGMGAAVAVQCQAPALESRNRGGVDRRSEPRRRLEDVRLHDLRHTVGHLCRAVRCQCLPRARSAAAQEPGDDGTLCEPRRRSGAHVE